MGLVRAERLPRATGTVIEQPFAEVLHFRSGLLFDGTPFYYDTAGIVAVL